MTTQEYKRRLSAILSADVEGYSRLMRDDEEATVRTLTTYRTAMTHLIEQYRGRVVDSPGDNILAEFTSVVDAVNCAVEIQRELAERNAELAENRRMQFRIGINLGDVLEEGKRIYGDGVNIAARMEALAEAGGIAISGTVHGAIENKIGLEYEDLGEHQVKNIDKPVRAYRVLSFPGAAAHRVVKAKRAVGRSWRNAMVAAAVVLLAGATFAVWNFYGRAPEFEPASKEKMAYPLPDKPSIAVLPFANMSGDPGQEFLSDGITENIITGLSQIKNLFVIARNSSFTYKGDPVKVQQVAENLGVRYVLEGSVQRSGERLRITAQFIDALKGHHLWSERYDRELKDLFAIEDDITKKIITGLQVILTQGEQARLYARGTENLDVYLKVMEAREQIFLFNKVANAAARQRLEEAISLDPGYSYAHALLGKTYIGDVFFGWSPSPKEALGRAYSSAKKALALDESNFQPHTTLAFVHLLKREHEEAVRESERAVELAPNAADSFFQLGVILRFAGRAKDAIPAFESAIRLNPIPPASYLYQLALSYTFVGEFEKAVRLCTEAISKNPDDLVGRVTLIIAYGSLGREEDARAQVSELLRVDPKFSLEQAAKTWPYKKDADRDLVLTALRKAGLPDKPPLPLPDKPSLAVLPFDNMSGDPKQEYLSDGITESIIMAVSKIRNLFVIARTSSFKYKGKEVDVRTVGRELGVQYVLEGSVQMSGDRLRITAQLIDASKGDHIWSDRYDRELKDLFEMQDEITMEISKAMRVKLIQGEQVLNIKRPSRIESALKLYEAHAISLQFTPEAIARAKKLLEEVVATEPTWGEAFYCLSVMHMLEMWYGTGKSPEESFSKAIEFGEKAVSLDVSLSGAWGNLGYLYGLRREWNKSLAYAEKGVAIDPNGADAHAWLGNCLCFAGNPQEAIPIFAKAMRLNPFPPPWYYFTGAIPYRQLGRYEEAVVLSKKALSVAPNNLQATANLVMCYSLMGKEDEARAAAAELLKINPRFSVDAYLKQLPYRDRDHVEGLKEAMRKAGLK